MPIPIPYQRAAQLCERIAPSFPELQFRPVEFPHKGYYVGVSRPDNENGLLLHADELDNGASGFRDDALERIAAYRDNRLHQLAPRPRNGIDYSDVMTAG